MRKRYLICVAPFLIFVLLVLFNQHQNIFWLAMLLTISLIIPYSLIFKWIVNREMHRKDVLLFGRKKRWKDIAYIHFYLGLGTILVLENVHSTLKIAGVQISTVLIILCILNIIYAVVTYLIPMQIAEIELNDSTVIFNDKQARFSWKMDQVSPIVISGNKFSFYSDGDKQVCELEQQESQSLLNYLKSNFKNELIVD